MNHENSKRRFFGADLFDGSAPTPGRHAIIIGIGIQVRIPEIAMSTEATLTSKGQRRA